MDKRKDNGFGIAHLHVAGKIDITLEMSFFKRDGTPLLEERIKQINAQLRFNHKITKPEWEIRRVGDGRPLPKGVSQFNRKQATA